MSGHTKGPWRALDGAILCGELNGYGNFIIAEINRVPASSEDEANAQLIAAAPCLLAACETASDAIDNNIPISDDLDTWGPVTEKLRAAISKARGQ